MVLLRKFKNVIKSTYSHLIKRQMAILQEESYSLVINLN